MVVNLRSATREDAAAIHAIYAPVVAGSAISFELEPPPVEEMAERIARTLERHPWIVCELDGEVAGYAYASAFRSRPAYRFTVETSVAVAPQYRGRGLSRRLYEELLRTLVEQGFHTAIAVIALPNDASIALHERLGFAHVGVLREVGFKHDAWRDVGLWQLLLQRSAGSVVQDR